MEGDTIELRQSKRSLTLADGTMYENSSCGYADGWLWCHLPSGTDIRKAFSDFSDAEKTQTILFRYGSDSILYTDFTEFYGITKDMDDQIRVQLRAVN